jgi:hypothetical protein
MKKLLLSLLIVSTATAQIGVRPGGFIRRSSTAASANQIAYWVNSHKIGGITAGNSSILVTNGSGVPSWATDIPTAVTIGSAYVYRVGGTDVAVADGGTGKSSWTVGDIAYASGATTLAGLADVAVGQVLISGGASTAPSWSASPYITGQLGVGLSALGGAIHVYRGAYGINTSGIVFDADGNSGWVGGGDNQVDLYLSGSTYYRAGTTGFYVNRGGSSGAALYYATSSLYTPSLLPYFGDTNTGIGGDGSDRISLVSGSEPNLIVTTSGVNVLDASSVGSECLSNGALTSGTGWTVTGDFALASDAATYTHSFGTGTLNQASGTMTIAGLSSRLYRLQYTTSSVTGTVTMTITTSFASESWPISTSAGTYYVYFKSAVAPGSFTISITTSATATLTIDALSLKEVNDGDILLPGDIVAYNGATLANPGATMVTTNSVSGMNKTVVTFASYSLTITDAAAAGAHGSVKLIDFPEGHIKLLGGHQKLTFTETGSEIDADAVFDAGIGSAAVGVDNEKLTGTECEITGAEEAALVASTLTFDTINSTDQTLDGSASASDAYLNVAIAAADCSGNSTLTVTGTATICWILLGDD